MSTTTKRSMADETVRTGAEIWLNIVIDDETLDGIMSQLSSTDSVGETQVREAYAKYQLAKFRAHAEEVLTSADSILKPYGLRHLIPTPAAMDTIREHVTDRFKGHYTGAATILYVEGFVKWLMSHYQFRQVVGQIRRDLLAVMIYGLPPIYHDCFYTPNREIGIKPLGSVSDVIDFLMRYELNRWAPIHTGNQNWILMQSSRVVIPDGVTWTDYFTVAPLLTEREVNLIRVMDIPQSTEKLTEDGLNGQYRLSP